MKLILQILRDHPNGLTFDEIRKLSGFTAFACFCYLSELIMDGVVEMRAKRYRSIEHVLDILENEHPAVAAEVAWGMNRIHSQILVRMLKDRRDDKIMEARNK